MKSGGQPGGQPKFWEHAPQPPPVETPLVAVHSIQSLLSIRILHRWRCFVFTQQHTARKLSSIEDQGPTERVSTFDLDLQSQESYGWMTSCTRLQRELVVVAGC